MGPCGELVVDIRHRGKLSQAEYHDSLGNNCTVCLSAFNSYMTKSKLFVFNFFYYYLSMGFWVGKENGKDKLGLDIA